tara:strand:- start:46 stop:609 length:564 start_codon:yes stop_codon:yes gene_type:complete
MINTNKNIKEAEEEIPNTSQKVSLRRLKNKAVHYLGRYASTEKKLTQVLTKFVKKKWPEVPIDEAGHKIQETVKWCREYGFVNDAGYAIIKVKSGRSKGYSAKQIKQRLTLAGISSQKVLAAFSEVEDTSDIEFQAALTMARKKRIGPYALSPVIGHEERTRQMSRLARAGYSYEICKNVFHYSEES